MNIPRADLRGDVMPKGGVDTLHGIESFPIV